MLEPVAVVVVAVLLGLELLLVVFDLGGQDFLDLARTQLGFIRHGVVS